MPSQTSSSSSNQWLMPKPIALLWPDNSTASFECAGSPMAVFQTLMKTASIRVRAAKLT